MNTIRIECPDCQQIFETTKWKLQFNKDAICPKCFDVREQAKIAKLVDMEVRLTLVGVDPSITSEGLKLIIWDTNFDHLSDSDFFKEFNLEILGKKPTTYKIE